MAAQIESGDVSKQRRQPYGAGSVYQRKDGRWVATLEAGWTPRGTRRRLQVSAKTEAECKRRLKAKQREVAREGIPDAGTSRATVKTWSATWLDMLARKARPNYYAADASAVRRWIVPTIGHRRLTDLGPQDARAVTAEIRKAGRSTTTARYAHGVLMRLLKAAIVEGHRVPERVLHTEKPGKGINDRDAVAMPDTLAMLAVAAQQPDGSRWVAAFLQGMRQGECLGLTWQCVDLAAGLLDVSWQLQALPYADRRARTFRVPDGYEARHLVDALHLVRPKTGRGRRVIPLVPWMTEALTGWRQVAPASPHDLVWPKLDGSPRRSGEDRAAWYALQDAAGVSSSAGRRYHLHEARHRTATLLLDAGVDPHVVTEILGHSSILTSRGYQHVSTDLARKALNAAAERLSLTTGTPQVTDQ